jgi:hypothetical protein
MNREQLRGYYSALLRFVAIFLVCVIPAVPALSSTGVQKHIVLRVDFLDTPTTTAPRYTRTQVEQLYANVTDLFTKISNGRMQATFLVSDVIHLPKNGADYYLGGEEKFELILDDAIAAAPPSVQAQWGGDVHSVIVLMSNKWSRGLSTYQPRPVGALLPTGGRANLFIGVSVVGENPGDTDLAVWGRWGHEVGHNFQIGGGPAHPSGYNSDFDLMDANYPGRVGPVSMQANVQFPNWLAPSKYQTFTPAQGGGNAAIWALEYDQNTRPNVQAVKVEINSNLYYMVSVRRRVRGDDLNANFQTQPLGQRGIPDEGVLIEQVDKVHNVRVIGRNATAYCETTANPSPCNRRQLWQEGQIFRSPEVAIEVRKKVDADDYLIRVIYNDVPHFPDVMINPWLSPPGNTWETTDIWVDSPVNGFGSYRYGMESDGVGGTVPAGNGDDPAIGMTNRVYARVRNVATSAAANVVVHIEVSDPLGIGITSGNWAGIGTVDATQFPSLASIPAGGFVDVYIDWVPNVTVTPAQGAAGIFYFHSCLRVRIDPVIGETVLANQDGDREQENISYFEAAPSIRSLPNPQHFTTSIWLDNPDLKRERRILLEYRMVAPNKLPDDWQVTLNKGEKAIILSPGERREVEVDIQRGQASAKAGQHYAVDVFGLEQRELVNSLDEKDRHNEFTKTGGARFQVIMVDPSKLDCSATRDRSGYNIVGRISPVGKKRRSEFRAAAVMAVATNTKGTFYDRAEVLMAIRRDGSFSGKLPLEGGQPVESVSCLFAGTTTAASARAEASMSH